MNQIKTILLVDDDPDDRFLFEEALAVAAPSIILETAVDGVDALEQLANGKQPDIIFMDVNMPRMNGIDCLRELQKSAFKDIPVIMYSTSSHYKKECTDCGAVNYIEKPNDFDQLCTRLKSVINNGQPSAQPTLP